jgi:thioredoxin-related protein
MQKVLTAILVLLLCGFVIPSTKKREKVNWISFEEAEKKMKEKPLPIIIDLYSNRCGWCKVMDKKTYTHDSVVRYINSNFYAIKFDAESDSPIVWKGVTYSYNARYNMHELAMSFFKQEAGFPTTVFIPFDEPDPQPFSGYLQPGDLHTLLTYYNEGYYKTIRFDLYANKFRSNW